MSMSMSAHLIAGFDAATNPKKCGLAMGQWSSEGLVIERAFLPANRSALVEELAEATAAGALLAIDAPLGWPKACAEELGRHLAGTALGGTMNAFFRRATDDDVYRRFGKRPLEVGANLIGRTAFSALGVLGDVRERSGLEVHLAWSAAEARSAAIEVYPAATLKALELPARGYKRDPAVRRELVDALRELAVEISLEIEDAAVASDDVFDAVLCVVAGAHFLAGCCPAPLDRVKARHEGWIHVGDTEAVLGWHLSMIDEEVEPWRALELRKRLGLSP